MQLRGLEKSASFWLTQGLKMGEKGLKFLIDVGVGKKVENWLNAQGYDTKSIRKLDPRMPDDEILKLATRENRMVLTMDKDFGELVFSSNFSHAGILILRLEDFNSAQKVNVVQKIMQQYQTKIIGKFCVYKDNKLRIR